MRPRLVFVFDPQFWGILQRTCHVLLRFRAKDRTLLGQKPVYLASFATDGTTFVTTSCILTKRLWANAEHAMISMVWYISLCNRFKFYSTHAQVGMQLPRFVTWCHCLSIRSDVFDFSLSRRTLLCFRTGESKIVLTGHESLVENSAEARTVLVELRMTAGALKGAWRIICTFLSTSRAERRKWLSQWSRPQRLNEFSVVKGGWDWGGFCDVRASGVFHKNSTSTWKVIWQIWEFHSIRQLPQPVLGRWFYFQRAPTVDSNDL